MGALRRARRNWLKLLESNLLVAQQAGDIPDRPPPAADDRAVPDGSFFPQESHQPSSTSRGKRAALQLGQVAELMIPPHLAS